MANRADTRACALFGGQQLEFRVVVRINRTKSARICTLPVFFGPGGEPWPQDLFRKGTKVIIESRAPLNRC